MARKPVKAMQEYQTERRRARQRVAYAKKKGYQTAAIPAPVRRGATSKELKAAARELRKVQKEQGKLTKERRMAPAQPIKEPEPIPDFYRLYNDKFLEQVEKIPDYDKVGTHGREVIKGWFLSLRSREGDKKAAMTIAKANNEGMVLQKSLFYEPTAKAWITEAIQYLGIEVPIEDMEDMTYQD